jgi:hypothetical protein
VASLEFSYICIVIIAIVWLWLLDNLLLCQLFLLFSLFAIASFTMAEEARVKALQEFRKMVMEHRKLETRLKERK